VFGSWTPTGVVKIKNKKTLCECKCSCGVVRFVRKDSLLDGHTKRCRACGHSKTTSALYQGVGLLSGIYFTRLQIAAKTRKIEFNVSIEYLNNLFKIQDGLCALSKVPLILSQSFSDGTQTASVDRINNDLGYTEGNLRWVHKDVNRLRGPLSDEDLIKWCKLIVQNWKEAKG
jgi:hypothetical protein